MKKPIRFNQNEHILDQFVVAADTTSLDSACDLLFIHGNDLTWGRPENGFFLSGIETDSDFEEVVQVVEARSKMNFIELAASFIHLFGGTFIETFVEAAQKFEGQDEEGKEQAITASVLSKFTGENQAKFDSMLPDVFGLRQWTLLADAIASSLVRGAFSLRKRQLASAGMTEDQYDAMLYALRRFDLCDHIVRIAYPQDGFHFEMSLLSGGEFKTADIREGANLVEVFRLKTDLATLKRGRDNALAVFIASYINKHFAGPPQAFSCAYYGEQNEPELDVIVPALNLGFEVKLYQAPFAQTDNKLVSMANNLKKQLKAYSDAGCERLYYVSNLSQERAASVLKQTQNSEQTGMIVEPVAGGISFLMPLLNEIGTALEHIRERNFELEIQRRMAVPMQEKTKHPPRSKKSSKRKGANK